MQSQQKKCNFTRINLLKLLHLKSKLKFICSYRALFVTFYTFHMKQFYWQVSYSLLILRLSMKYKRFFISVDIEGCLNRYAITYSFIYLVCIYKQPTLSNFLLLFSKNWRFCIYQFSYIRWKIFISILWNLFFVSTFISCKGLIICVRCEEDCILSKQIVIRHSNSIYET